MKKLSVIIPVYNSEKYIRKCLDSIINNTYKNVEVIVVNDGSKDNSLSILNDYKKKYPDIIKIYTNKNHGQAFSRNYGFNKSTGEYISFIDSDDYIESTMFEDMINLMENENTDYVMCDMNQITNDISEVISLTTFGKYYEVTKAVWNKIYKRDTIKNISFIEGYWYEDLDYTMKLIINNKNYSLCHKPLYNYIIHDNSTMNNKNTYKNLDIINIVDDIYEYSKDNDLLRELIVDQILLTCLGRIYNHNIKDRNKVYKIILKYCKNNNVNLNSSYIYNNYSLSKKIIVYLNYHRLYFISCLLLKLKKVLKCQK